MARKKETGNVKQLRGTSQPCRGAAEEWVEFDALDKAPEAPSWLDIRAKKFWDRIVPILIRKKVLSVADLEALETMCILYGRVRQMSEAGVDLNSSLVTQLRLYQAEFGLTPQSRKKVGAGAEGPKGNKFANNGRRKS